MNNQFKENGQDKIHQHFFTPENVKPTFDGQPEADDNDPQKLVDYLYEDTTPWDKTRHDKEAEITGGSNPVGLKGVIRFLKDRKEFDLKIRLYHGYKSKTNPETGTFDPFYKPSGILIQRGTWDINLNIPVVVFWSREETVEVSYDPRQADLKLLIELFFKTIDPTSINRQGNDIGSQYRTGIYYTNTDDLPIIKETVEALAKNYTKPIVVEIQPLSNFYPAEDYHQDYLDKHPDGYCHISPDLFDFARKANKGKASNKPVSQKKFQKPDDQTLRSKLTAEQYAVTQQNATERAFKNEYWNEKREGIYVDITTGEPLFISTDKFDSGCGWPSFSKPIDKSLVMEKTDLSHGMKRIEIRSKTGDAHLGHVFNDGPAEKGGLRYCINSASLRFIPKAKMEEEGYADYLPLL